MNDSTFIVTNIALRAALALIAAAIAAHKGRGEFRWAIAVFFFGLIPFVVLPFLRNLRKSNQAEG